MAERVSLVSCASTASDSEVVAQAQTAIQHLGDYGKGLRNAACIAVKINVGGHHLTLRVRKSITSRIRRA